MVVRIVALILFGSVLAEAQSHVVGYGGILSRVKPEKFDFATFRSGPSSDISPVIGFGGGTTIKRIRIDGTFIFTPTGETTVIVGPTREFEETSKGSAILVDAGAGLGVLRVRKFTTSIRAGIGKARVRIPTIIPIEADRRFWTYGIVTTRNIASRYVLRIDVRNVHFGRDEVPQTLGRFNVVVLGGFGLRR